MCRDEKGAPQEVARGSNDEGKKKRRSINIYISSERGMDKGAKRGNIAWVRARKQRTAQQRTAGARLLLAACCSE